MVHPELPFRAPVGLEEVAQIRVVASHCSLVELGGRGRYAPIAGLVELVLVVLAERLHVDPEAASQRHLPPEGRLLEAKPPMLIVREVLLRASSAARL